MNELSHDQDREKIRTLDVSQRIKHSLRTLGGDAEVAAAEHSAIAHSREDLAQQTSVEQATHQKELRTINPEAHDKSLQRDQAGLSQTDRSLRSDIERRHDPHFDAERDSLNDSQALALAREDLTKLNSIKDPLAKRDAAVTMLQTADGQTRYRAHLRLLDPDAVKFMEAAKAEDERAQLEKEERKKIEWRDMQKERASDHDKPAFTAAEEVERSKARDPQPGTRQSAPGKKDEETEKEYITPQVLRNRYLQAENKFYFRQETNKVAFEDKGKRLATEHNDPEIAKSMVELASAKGWTAIKLKGTDEFKREAWLHASLRGMEVQGYKPKDADLARLADRQTEQGGAADKSLNSIERSVSMDKEAVVDEQQRTLSAEQRTAIDHLKAILRARGDSEKAVDMAASMTAERFQTNRVHVGKIVEYGRAPYEHDKRNEESYYLKLKTGGGERTVWGIDLKRATEDGNANVGDEVAVAYQGRQQVTVKVKERDEHGKETGDERDLLTYRNTWEVSRLDKMREDIKEKIAQQARAADRQPQIPVYDRAAGRAQPRPEMPPPQAKERERDRPRS